LDREDARAFTRVEFYRDLENVIRDYLVGMIWEKLEPAIESIGFELVEVEFSRGKNKAILRLYVDSEEGVNVSDCAAVSRHVNPILDVEGIDELIGGAYSLELSSPGLTRPLRRTKDFIRFCGKQVKIKTYQKIDGRRNFSGLLIDCNGQTIRLKVEESEFEIDLQEIKKANLEYVPD
jgi:ribosome maturation factor RimP